MQKIGKLSSTNKKVIGAHFDLPKIDSAHVLKQLQTLIAHISRKDRDIDKRKMAILTTINFT